jgi:hypothetical protein
MSAKTELGRIETISISKSEGKSKKLVEIPLLFYKQSIKLKLPEKYDSKIDQFYDSLTAWVKQLEGTVGHIKKIYVESITETDEAAILELKTLTGKNERLLQIIGSFLKLGAKLEKTEDKDLLLEYLEWVNAANSPDALDITFEYLLETKRERTYFIIKRIEETLLNQEIGVLFITFDLKETIDYPDEIEIIRFAPPVVDDILKFLK